VLEHTSDQIARLPCWNGRVEIAPLVGGITNRNYLVRERSGARFVVRVGRDIPQHGVLRFNELAAARAAHAAGVSPEVTFAAEGVLVSRFIEGRTLTPEDVRIPATMIRIAAVLRRFHTEVPRHLRGPALIFWVFHVIRDYLATLAGTDANPLGLDLAGLGDEALAYERAVGAVEIVYGHNDLLAANLIDDGERLWFIDFDYAGFNCALFDLANLASNNGFDAALEHALLAAYDGASPSAARLRAFHALLCASLLRETLWGAVSLLTSSIAFDYAAYTRENLARYEAQRERSRALLAL
jgi:thiamine kinase-like enzyme